MFKVWIIELCASTFLTQFFFFFSKTSWETVGKKKPLVKEAPSESKENKENREKKGEREASKARPASSRKGKGGNRSRQGRETLRLSNNTFPSCGLCHAPTRLSVPASSAARPEENGVEVTPVEKASEKGSERGRRQRGARGERTLQTESLRPCPHQHGSPVFSLWRVSLLVLSIIFFTSDSNVLAEHQQAAGLLAHGHAGQSDVWREVVKARYRKILSSNRPKRPGRESRVSRMRSLWFHSMQCDDDHLIIIHNVNLNEREMSCQEMLLIQVNIELGSF